MWEVFCLNRPKLEFLLNGNWDIYGTVILKNLLKRIIVFFFLIQIIGYKNSHPEFLCNKHALDEQLMELAGVLCNAQVY